MESGTANLSAPRTFIVRILRREHDDWQGQLLDVASGEVHPFRSFLHLQRFLLSLDAARSGEAGHGQAAAGEGTRHSVRMAREA